MKGSDVLLKPITKKMTDESGDGKYQFAFYCDICETPKQSIVYESESPEPIDEKTRKREHAAAYERANVDVIRGTFNRCPICKKIVCDDCFRVFDENMCKECAAADNRE